MKNDFKLSSLSILLAYQVVQKLPVQFYAYDDQIFIAQPETILVPFLGVPLYADAYILSLITLWTNHGRGIHIKLAARPIKDKSDVFVKIFDGPILMGPFDLDRFPKRTLRYAAGFRLTIGIESINNVTRQFAKLTYQTFQQRQQQVDLNKHQDATWKISIDTTKKAHNRKLYYKYLTVSTTKSKYLQMTFTNLRQFSYASKGCEDGGFVLSEESDDHGIVTGPFCSQRGTEPLVNAIKTFHSSHEYITIFIYSYTFQMKVDITFRHAECQGITNPCTRFCNLRRDKINETQNYWTETSLYQRTCSSTIHLKMGCVVLQKIPGRNSKCKLMFFAHGGLIKTTDFKVVNNIR